MPSWPLGFHEVFVSTMVIAVLAFVAKTNFLDFVYSETESVPVLQEVKMKC